MPDHGDPIRAALDALAGYMVGSMALAETLDHVASVTVAAYPAARYAGISTIVDGEPRTAVFTHPDAPEIDAAQYESGSGPCLDAYRDRTIHRINDTETDRMWVDFCRAARAHGIRSTISLPMVANGEGIGALNLYSEEVAGFADADEEVGLSLATQAAVVLANSQVYWDAYHLTQNLQEALRAAHLIRASPLYEASVEALAGIIEVARQAALVEIAVGMLIVSQGLTPDGAWAHLHALAAEDGSSISDRAEEMIAAHERAIEERDGPPSS